MPQDEFSRAADAVPRNARAPPCLHGGERIHEGAQLAAALLGGAAGVTRLRCRHRRGLLRRGRRLVRHLQLRLQGTAAGTPLRLRWAPAFLDQQSILTKAEKAEIRESHAEARHHLRNQKPQIAALPLAMHVKFRLHRAGKLQSAAWVGCEIEAQLQHQAVLSPCTAPIQPQRQLRRQLLRSSPPRCAPRRGARPPPPAAAPTVRWRRRQLRRQRRAPPPPEPPAAVPRPPWQAAVPPLPSARHLQATTSAFSTISIRSKATRDNHTFSQLKIWCYRRPPPPVPSNNARHSNGHERVA